MIERTALWSEGAGDITPDERVEAWARHMMHRLSVWEDGGRAHAGRSVFVGAGKAKDAAFVGHDATLGRLRRAGDAVKLDPLTNLLEIP